MRPVCWPGPHFFSFPTTTDARQTGAGGRRCVDAWPAYHDGARAGGGQRSPHRNGRVALQAGRLAFPNHKPTYYAALTDAYIVYPWEIDRTCAVSGWPSRSSPGRTCLTAGRLSTHSRKTPVPCVDGGRFSVLPGASGDEVICTCGHCGSQFIYDPAARKSRYVYVAPDYAAVADRLLGRPLTRRDVRGDRRGWFGGARPASVARGFLLADPCRHDRRDCHHVRLFFGACPGTQHGSDPPANRRAECGCADRLAGSGDGFRRDRPRRRRNCADRGGSSAS